MFLKCIQLKLGIETKDNKGSLFYYYNNSKRMGGYTWNKDKGSIYVFYKLFSYLMLLIEIKNQSTKPPQTLIVV